jgi:hypothetical protein
MLFHKIMFSVFFCLILSTVLLSALADPTCSYSNKALSDGNCIPLATADVVKAIHFLANPASTTCNRISTVQNISVCEDTGAISFSTVNKCVVWSVIAIENCKNIGNLDFEKYWSSKGCMIEIFVLRPIYKGTDCTVPIFSAHPEFKFAFLDLFGPKKCYGCFYRFLIDSGRIKGKPPDILKIQRRTETGMDDEYDGIQYTILSDLYLYTKDFISSIPQIVFTVSLNTRTLIDHLGREAEHGWNIWASQQSLQNYSSFSRVLEEGSLIIQPRQFDHLLSQAKVSTNYSFYHLSLLRITSEEGKQRNLQLFSAWTQNPPQAILPVVPAFCQVPSSVAYKEMHRWILTELNSRCHPTRLAVPCDSNLRKYDAILPCQKDLMNYLAEDYAISKKWCNFRVKESNIETLKLVDKRASLMFSQPPLKKGIRLAFFFTVYSDFPLLKRLFSHLYCSKHYYLFHIDLIGSTPEFEAELRKLADGYENVFVVKEIPIVYGAATASMLLTKAMAWFYRYTKGWDYLVTLTGSDYPLVPLKRLEKILECQNPPMPFVMSWSLVTTTHLIRLQKTHPIFELNPLINSTFSIMKLERGKTFGANSMEFRSGNFGPPLLCNNQTSFYHLNNRFNKSGLIYDTQWLFPRDIFKKRGKAVRFENPQWATPSFDNIWRVWRKSDPATTGIYDRDSIRYIVNSVEGKKYWYFFKHMLLGSEEHYYVSLLYNWRKTQGFVQSMNAQSVWNTWIYGLRERQSGGFLTHTHFLTMNLWDILKGLSMRGVMFARKFNSKKTPELLDLIDREILFNNSFPSGIFWPGFYSVDMESSGKYFNQLIRENASVPGSIYKMSKEKISAFYESKAWKLMNMTSEANSCLLINALDVPS